VPSPNHNRGGKGIRTQESNIDEDIEVHVDKATPGKKDDDDIDEEIDYDDDFEDVADDDDDEYQPQIKPTASPEPEKQNKVTIRPQSNQSKRVDSPSDQYQEVHTMAKVKKAMDMENERLAAASKIRGNSNADDSKGGKGIFTEYESTIPKFNLTSSNTSASARAATRRLRDIRNMKLFEKRATERMDLFQQRPQKDISLFLAGKSLKYCNLQSVSCQTGDDDMEVGVMTDDIWTEEKEMQFPTLNLGQAATSDGEVSQLLPFLRRVMPLFEASMSEAWQGAVGSVHEGAGLAADQHIRSQARCGIAESFVSQYIGANVNVEDITICPRWYGADHALVLYSWPEVQRPPPTVGGSLDSFVRPLRSLVGLYPLLASTAGSAADGSGPLRPVRVLASFCRLCSLTVVNGRQHLIVAGSEMGSLLVWDLRQKPRHPGGNSGAGAAVEAASVSPDPEVAHFEGPIWLLTTFSTDLFAFSTVSHTGNFDAGDDGEVLQLSGTRGGGDGGGGGGVHSVEICCVRCSDVIGGDCLIFALDAMGIVSFWRVMELANVSHQSMKLALQGSICVGEGSRLLGDFLGASCLCIHPQQQAQFVVASTSGLRQSGRKRSAAVADGPSKLELTLGIGLSQEGEEPLSSLEQPVCAAFSPFFPGLLLAAYAEGDLALFDCSLCVPITHWASAITKAPNLAITVAWSPRRPCVFFVKCGSVLDVWDLSVQVHAPVQMVDLESHFGPPVHGGGGNGFAMASRASCAELFVDPGGQPVIGHNGSVVVLTLPVSLTSPLQEDPPQHSQFDKPLDELLVDGCEKAQTFPTLSKHSRSVDIPESCVLEKDLLRRLLAGIQPMQAAV
jgi:hypothetical protein